MQLDKLDRYVCLKPSDVVISADPGESSSDEDDDDSDGSESDDDDNETLVARSSAGSPVKGLDDDELDEKEAVDTIVDEVSDKVNLLLIGVT